MIDNETDLKCGTWIALSLERQTIQGYLDDGEFVEGPSEPPTTLSQRELMRHRLWRLGNEIFFENAGEQIWRGLVQVDSEHAVVEFANEGGDSEQLEVWFEEVSQLVMCVEAITGGQYLKREKWAFQRLRAIESSIYGHDQAPCLLKAIADQPIEQCEFSSHRRHRAVSWVV